MEWILNLLMNSLERVGSSISANWPFLLASIGVAAVLNVYVDSNRVLSFFKKNRGTGIVAATTAAVATPLCSCGTTAVVLGLMAGQVSWAPIVAFMVASPLSSPEGLIYSAGLFGWPFALMFFGASVVLGLSGGLAAALLESRKWLVRQARYVAACCGLSAKSKSPRANIRLVSASLLRVGYRLTTMFLVYTFVGYILNGLIPRGWMTALFGKGRFYSVPLAALLGLPFYVNSETSLPMVRALLRDGMSQGAAMAFLITGAGTSLGAVAGALTIARWRVVGLVVGTLLAGAVVFGFVYDGLLTAGLF